MDTSEQYIKYIKMCEKADEIQKLMPELYHKHKVVATEGETIIVTKEEFVYHHDNSGIKIIWLPRQDQLQEMMSAHWNLTYTLRLVNEFSRWLKVEGVGKYENLSMEQLWLAFVMKEKYGKTWNGNEWIKAE